MAYGSDASLGWFVRYTVAMDGSSLIEQLSKLFKGTCNPQPFWDFPLECRESRCHSNNWHAYKLCVILLLLLSSSARLQLR